MDKFLAPRHITRHYPRAVRSKAYLGFFLKFMEIAYKLEDKQIAFLTSICSDDLNNVQLPSSGMVGPFILGGLNGLPFVGRTGLVAFSHHIPDNGAACMFYGPHVGITDEGEVGKVLRPGQSKPNSCCGAAAGALQKLCNDEIQPKEPHDYDPLDYQQETIEQIFLRNKATILGQTGDARFVTATEVVYQDMKGTIQKLLSEVDFHHPVFVFGGILINEDMKKGSSIELRDVIYSQNRKPTSIASEFKNFIAENATKFNFE